MEVELLKLLVNIGAAAAVVGVVILFLRHMTLQRQEDRAERQAERATLVEIIKNDLAHIAATLVELVRRAKGD